MKQGGSIMKKIKIRKFFTLLEVLVSMGVFSLLMLALMQFFSAAPGVWEKSGSKSELFDSARIAAQLLTEDLTTAFYGDEEHDMSKYKFYQNDSTRLTFAAQRSGGLTEVDYNWNQTDLTLEIRELPETDNTASIGASGWVTYPSNAWITTIRGKTATPIAENVLYANFGVDAMYRAPGDANRPPRMVMATFALLSSAGYDKLDTLLKSVKSDASESDIKGAVKGFFDKMTESSKDKFKSVDDAVKQESDDPANFKAVSVPAKQIIFDNVQFFKLIIPIER